MRKSREALRQVLVGGNGIRHLPIVKLLIGVHIKVACSGEAKEDGLLLACLASAEGLIDGHLNGVAVLRGGQDSLHPGKLLRSRKY